MADAMVFGNAQRALREPTHPASLDSVSRWNWLAQWRLQLLRFRAAHLRGDLASAGVELEALLNARHSAGRADLDPSEAFRAYHESQIDAANSVLELAPPWSAHLLNLPSILAGAEAVAISGSQALAGRWLSWLAEKLPVHVETSLEWPVSRARVEALLTLRSGDPQSAGRLFERATVWAQQVGHPCELAITHVQMAELHHHHVANPLRVRAELQSRGREAWAALQARGLEPARYAYQVARLSAWTKDQLIHAALTPREQQVIALLADGLSYKQIADQIGVKWPTVQVLAHRCYDKLGVSGRARAVQAAREQGIL